MSYGSLPSSAVNLPVNAVPLALPVAVNTNVFPVQLVTANASLEVDPLV